MNKPASARSGVSDISELTNTTGDSTVRPSSKKRKKKKDTSGKSDHATTLGRSDHSTISSTTEKSQEAHGSRRRHRSSRAARSSFASNLTTTRLQAPQPPSGVDKEQSQDMEHCMESDEITPGAIAVAGIDGEPDESGTLTYDEEEGAGETTTTTTAVENRNKPIVAHLARDQEEITGIIERLSSVLQHPIVVAQPMDDNNNRPEQRQKICGVEKTTFLVVLVIFITLVIGAAIALGLVFSNRMDDGDTIPSTQPPTDLGSVDSTIDDVRIGPALTSSYEILNPHLSNENLQDPTSPQWKALQWIESPNTSYMNLDTELPHVVLERYVMAVFYFSMSGGYWDSNVNFLSPDSICDWYSLTSNVMVGVICEDGSVTDIILPDLGLAGTLPTELALLSNLRVLNLHNNSIMGRLPTDLATLSNLQELRLSRNSITGSLPTEFGSLTNLYEIFLGRNGLTGIIPSHVGLWTKLEYLGFARNQLVGSIPTSISNLINLIHLDLDKNSITGTIQTKLGLLTNLNQISLEDNKFAGTLPSQLSNLSLLKKLWIENNRFTGSIPIEYGYLTSLVEVKLENNFLTDGVETAFCNNRINEWQYLTADCDGNVPEVECSCCTECY